ncbi:MAG: LytR C-terminal domain-containing protein [candidate division WOR-3 bacterium]
MKTALAWTVLVLVFLAAGASVTWRMLPKEEPLELNPGDVRLEVVNGCGVPRLANAVRGELEARGFAAMSVRNSDSVCAKTAVVDLLDPGCGCAGKVARALSRRQRRLGLPVGPRFVPKVSAQIDSTKFLDVIVVVGQDYRQFFPNLVVLY